MASLIFAIAVAVRRYAILPRWLSSFGFVAGVAAISSGIFFTMIVWLLFIAVVSVTLFLVSRPEAAARREPSAATS
jgi:ABC-type multidrug transport system permease subunit